MHFGFKIRISSFAIILYPEWLDFCFIKDLLYTCFCKSGKPCVSSRFSGFIYVLCKFGISPSFCRIAKISRSLAGNADDPSFFIISDFSISPTPRSIKDGIFCTTIFIFLKAEQYTVTVKAYLLSYSINRVPISFKKKDSCSGYNLSLHSSGADY